jgi:CHAD domain-containing protein
MGYRIERGEGMADGVRRIVVEQLEGAKEQLSGQHEEDLDEAVHDARKRLKKSRSALRLVRDDIGQDVRRRENRIMREAGRRLSGARDAQVLLETLEVVIERDRPAAPPADVVRPFRERLVARRTAKAEELRDGDAAPAVAARLDKVISRSAGWPLTDQSFANAERGLRRIHQRGRRAMDAALESGRDEAWHEWRKRVKDLWYQLRIVRNAWPEVLDETADQAHELSDLLGDHHDLAVLRDDALERRELLADGELERVLAAISERQDELADKAISLGHRIYAEKPKAFVRRLQSYWQAWR